MRVFIVVGLLLAVVLAGCASDNDVSDVDVAVTEPRLLMPDLLPDGSEAPLVLEHTGCTEIFAVFPAPADEMEAFLPEGFKAVPYDATGLRVVVYGIAYTCTHGEEEVSEFVGYLAVEPSKEYRMEEEPEAFVSYAVVLGAYTTSAAVAEVFEAWHANGVVSVGDVQVGALAPSTPLVQTGHALGDGDGGTFHMYSTVPSGTSQGDGGMWRVFFVDHEDQSVAGAHDITWNAYQSSDEGTAVLQIEDGPLSYVEQGAAYHLKGDDYGYVYTYVPL